MYIGAGEFIIIGFFWFVYLSVRSERRVSFALWRDGVRSRFGRFWSPYARESHVFSPDDAFSVDTYVLAYKRSFTNQNSIQEKGGFVKYAKE